MSDNLSIHVVAYMLWYVTLTPALVLPTCIYIPRMYIDDIPYYHIATDTMDGAMSIAIYVVAS